MQIEELGTLETPIILTNTLSVGTAYEGLVRYMLDRNEDVGDTTGTVNPVICECNDSSINDIRGLHVNVDHVYDAIKSASVEFSEGDVGAGTGMKCYDLKGGIRTASRIVELNNVRHTVGILTLTNFGSLEDFVLNGDHIGKSLSDKVNNTKTEDKGSIIVILATDIPLTSRQLKRVIKRLHLGIGRTGSYTGNGSGEVVIGFSTANTIKHYEKEDIISIKAINENKKNDIFKATVEATEEAILNSLICSNATIARNGKKIYSLKDLL